MVIIDEATQTIRLFNAGNIPAGILFLLKTKISNCQMPENDVYTRHYFNI